MDVINYRVRGRIKGTTFPEARQSVQLIYQQLRAKADRDGKTELPRFRLHLVADPENQYDANAVKVFVQTQLYGKLFIGHISARRFCPYCDTDQSGQGYPAYGEKAQELCPQCQTELRPPDNEQLSQLLRTKATCVDAFGFFVGGTQGRENLGIIYEIAVDVIGDDPAPVDAPTPADFPVPSTAAVLVDPDTTY